MRKSVRSFVIVLLALNCSACWAAPGIHYRLAMPQPWTHLFEVEISLTALPREAEDVELVMPAWRSGRYAILDFAGGVVAFSASDDRDRTLSWEKTDKNTWRVKKGKARSLRVDYRVYADEFALRTRGLNSNHGFVDGTSVFLYLAGCRDFPVDLEVLPYDGWHVTTGLDSLTANHFRAPSYDVLVDCPLEIGTQRDYSFVVEGKPHVASLYGPLGCDVDSLLADLSAIVRMNARFWGDLPYRRYVFLFHAFPGGGGGTEHLNSSVLDVAPDFSPYPHERKELRGLISHEFFHTWNVKQFRPKGMDPYDWTKENYYRELWIAEGATTYMHGRLLALSGLTGPLSPASVALEIQSGWARPGNQSQSVVECSFDAWIKAFVYREEAFNFQADLYGKGAEVCMLMDLEIRRRSENAHSFDDVLKTLYRRFPLGGGGYTVEDVERIAGELAGSSMRDFFDAYVFGRQAFDWKRALLAAGLQLDTSASGKPWWGVETAEEGGRTLVRQVVRGSAAYAAGLQIGDEIVALDGVRVGTEALQKRIEEFRLGDTIRLTLFREERQLELPVALLIQENPIVHLTKVAAPTKLQREIYSSWLGAPW